MRGLQRSPHVTTTMKFPAESTLVSILYLQQPEHPARWISSLYSSGAVQRTVQWAGPASSAPSQPPLESVNSRLSSGEVCRRATPPTYFNRVEKLEGKIFRDIDMTSTRW